MSGHNHGGAASGRAGARHAGRLRLVLGLTLVLVAVQGTAALALGSLALLSDTGHVLTDAVGIGMALAAIQIANRPASPARHTFGLYRLEVLAALANASLLIAAALYVLWEAVSRFGDPPEIEGGALLFFALFGLGMNLVAFLILRPGAAESINVRGAQLEVLADLAGSIGVLVAAVTISVTGWNLVDPLTGAAIGLFILPRAGRLAAQSLRILLQVAPPHLDVDELRSALAALPEVVDVHDLHVWTLTSDMEVASAHLMVRSDADLHGVLDQARALLADEHGIDHATLQVEPEDHTGCADVDW